jgi:hypothetical protein
MHTTVRRVTNMLVAAGVMAAAAGVTMQPASAGGFNNRGVKDVDYEGAIDSCISGQALPCTPNAGSGASNVLRIKQVETFDGGLVFHDVETTSAWGDDYLWLGATIAAECKWTYDLWSANIMLGWVYGNDHAWPEIQWPGTSVNISVPDAQAMPEKLVALNYSLDEVFGGGHVWDFGSLDEVYDYAEAMIDARVAAGMNEAQARSIGFSFDTWVATHAEVGCARSDNMPWLKMMGWYHPVTIEFVPVPRRPVRNDYPPAEDLVTEPDVTAASLAVIADPEDECTVHLSGTVTTTAPTEVEYRFVNPYGQPSNTYTVDVGATRVAMFDHSTAIPTAPDPDPQGDLADPGGGDDGDGDIDDEAVGESDQWSGVFELEILGPGLLTAVDGFSVDYCPGAIAPPTRR